MYIPANSWRRLYEVDFAAQPTINPLTNGAHVIAGKTWTFENAANGTSQALLNGTGIQFVTLGGPYHYGDGLRTAPLIRVDLTDLVGPVEFAMIEALRLRTQILVQNATEDGELGKMGLEYQNDPDDFNLLPGRGWPVAPGEDHVGIQDQLSDSGGISTRNSVPSPSNDDVVELIWRPEGWVHDCRSSLFSGGFPQSSDYVFSSMALFGVNVVASQGSRQLRVVFDAQPTDAVGSATFTFTRLQIDARIRP